jgi:hypothetical protein
VKLDDYFNTFERYSKITKMKFKLFVISIFIINSSIYAQLDPFYLGIYTNEAQTESYNINFIPDEGVEAKDCFLLLFTKMANGKNISVTKGVGYCESEMEHIEIRLENSPIPLEVDFTIDSKGSKVLTIHHNDEKIGIYTELVEIIESDETFADKIYARKDGSEILVSHNYDGAGFLFIIYGKTTDKCVVNEISGTAKPINSDQTLFEFKSGAGRIVFNLIGKNMTVTEEHNLNANGSTCISWTGDYLLK